MKIHQVGSELFHENPPGRIRVISCGRTDMTKLTIENCALLGHYAAGNGNILLTFRDNLWGPIFRGSRIGILDPLNTGPIGCPETSPINYHYPLCNDPEERSSHPLRDGNLKSLKLVVVSAILRKQEIS